MRLVSGKRRGKSASIRGHAAAWKYDLEVSAFGARRGRPPKKDLLWMGVRGVVAQMLNSTRLASQILPAYRRDGWPGVQVGLALSGVLSDEEKVAALLESAQFSRIGWVIDRCEHPRPHPQRVKRGAKHWSPVPPLVQGSHWYVRPNRGRRPLACFLAREAAKKYRARPKHTNASQSASRSPTR